MDINKAIEIIRESKRKSKCPPGSKWDKKLKSCVPKKYSGKGVYLGWGRNRDEKDEGDDDSKKNGKNGSNGNGHNNGGSGNGNGGNGNGGNGNGGSNGGGGE